MGGRICASIFCTKYTINTQNKFVYMLEEAIKQKHVSPRNLSYFIFLDYTKFMLPPSQKLYIYDNETKMS